MLIKSPSWLLLELTYKCPLKCLYCSNPLNKDEIEDSLNLEDWKKVLSEARSLGCVQLGISGGEPLLFKPLDDLILFAREKGFYTNLITSGIGLTSRKLDSFKRNGLDHIQLSMQGSDLKKSNEMAQFEGHLEKIEKAKMIKALGFPMVLNVVIHKQNIDDIEEIILMAEELGVDYLELANTQYEGFASENFRLLLPTNEQIRRSQEVVERYQAKVKFKIVYVYSDWFQDRPKPCMNGWGNMSITVTPDGLALPCLGARKIKNLVFDNVRNKTLKEIWYDSSSFNAYRGESWMKSPCKECPERKNDYGGCRCQAFELTGDAANTDPVCSKSPDRGIIDQFLAGRG